MSERFELVLPYPEFGLWLVLGVGGIAFVEGLLRKRPLWWSCSMLVIGVTIFSLRPPALYLYPIFWSYISIFFMSNLLFDRPRTLADRLARVAVIGLLFAWGGISISSHTPRHAIEIREQSIAGGWGEHHERIARHEMWITVLHYAEDAETEWVLRSPKPNVRQIRISSDDEYRDPAGRMVSGATLGKRIASWAGVTPIENYLPKEDQTPTL